VTPADAPPPPGAGGRGNAVAPPGAASLAPMTAPAGGTPPVSEAPPPGGQPQGALRGVSTKPCRSCGGVNGPSARFCQLCGVPLDGGSGERPRSRPPPPPGTAAAAERMPEADLVVIAQDGSPGRRYALSKSTMTVGSGSTDISLRKDPYVSPVHAEVSYRNGRFSIKDGGSENGVFVRLSGSVALNSGDLLLLGLAVLRFETVAESERNLTAKSKNGVRVFGTPPTPRYAKITVVTVEDQPRDVYFLSRAETVLGREVGDIVFTDDPFMSRRHAAIRRDPNTNLFSIRDLGSSNGTFLAIRASHALSSGDYVRIGQHLFRLDVRRD
jgi:pSer/pThr/pTyr-binding forkhead associated (FHA) protein